MTESNSRRAEIVPSEVIPVEVIKTATLVKDGLPWASGHAKLYRVSPPMEARDWDGEVEAVYEYVAVSATRGLFSGPETYIFGADEEGTVESWGELDGSYRGGLDHEAALNGAGYEVVS